MSDKGRIPLDIGVVHQPLEGRFAVDRQHRITEWDYGATELAGIPAAQVVGRPCYEVVQGLDSFGRTLCGPDCPAQRALRRGHFFGGTSLTLRGRDGRALRLRCELTALPSFPGGALGRLRQPGDKASALAHDLASAATFATMVPAASLRQRVEGALDFVLEASAAEAAEVFLAEPGGKGMVLTFHRGSFRKAFSQMLRFSPGEGFPGLALARREPVYTDRLLEDPRYLRTQVKQQGFQSYVCVPLFGFGGVVGSISVAFRQRDADVNRSLQLLHWVGAPLGFMVEAGVASLRQTVDARLVSELVNGDDPERHFHVALQSMLVEMVRLSGAQSGEVHLRRESGNGEWVSESLGAVPGCPWLEDGLPTRCPVVAEGQAVVLHGPRTSWLASCQGTPHPGGVLHCIPLLTSGQAIGLVRLAYRRLEGLLPSRDVVVLESVAASAAPVILGARDSLERARRTDAALRVWLHRPDASLSPQHDGAEASVEKKGSETPYLDIHCFGHFELSVGGQTVTPTMVPRRRTLTLLKALLVQKGRPVPKDVLIEMLWPNAEPDARNGQFYVLVHELRKLLEPGVGKRGWTYVCNDGDRYYFNLKALCRLDVHEFGTLVDLGRRAQETGNAEAAIAAYLRAVELYRGEFMEDEPFAEWCSQERVEYRETCLDVLMSLAGLLAKMGKWDQSVRYLRRSLVLDQIREEVHRELMYALWALGRRDEAVRQYETCVGLLRSELGVGPLPETERMMQRIRTAPRP